MNQDIRAIFTSYRAGTWRDDLSLIGQLSRPHLGRLAAAVVCSAFLSGINGGIAWMIKPALDSIFIRKSVEFLFLLPFGVVTLFLLRGLFTYVNNYLMGSIGAKIVRDLRKGIYEKLLALPLSYFQQTTSGSLVSKVLNDVELLHLTVAHTIKDFFVEGGTVLVLAAVAMSRKWELALLSFVVIPLIVLSIGKLGQLMKKTSMKTRQLISQVTTIIHESLQGMKIIKAFTMEKEMHARFEGAVAEHYRNKMRETRIDELSSLIAEILGGVGVAVILYYGGHLVISDRITTGDFFSFIAAILMIYTPLKRLSRVNNNFQQARNVLGRVGQVILSEGEREGGQRRKISGEIAFEDVSFRYPSAVESALKNINLKIGRGEIVALVGHSGAGKSTLVDLITGFWSPTGGKITIDGLDLNSLSLACLREGMGMVTQDIVLFDDTIRANILFGRPGATDEEMVEAAKAAYAHEFIMELPEGYLAGIGERGVLLSGGQKQRITLARAILRNPAILLLDEATSSLDTESEQKVQKALESLMVGRTTIVIAHRLSTIRKASRIIVLNKGLVVEEGSHEELLARNGLYRELYTMQFASAQGTEA
jgi:subfamily B ATP-binding cassette protein MsbA